MPKSDKLLVRHMAGQEFGGLVSRQSGLREEAEYLEHMDQTAPNLVLYLYPRSPGRDSKQAWLIAQHLPFTRLYQDWWQSFEVAKHRREAPVIPVRVAKII